MILADSEQSRIDSDGQGSVQEGVEIQGHHPPLNPAFANKAISKLGASA